MMGAQRYRADGLVEFGKDVLVKVGFPEKQAYAASKILIEADLRGDPAHGIAGGSGLEYIVEKVHDDEQKLGFKRIQVADFTIDEQKYPAVITADAHGTLGHYVTLEIMPRIIETARRVGYAKAYIRNSTHFGNCGIYTEMIAGHDLAGKVTSTAPGWTKPFIELQDPQGEDSPANRARYEGVKKRLGTNPIAWSIPYQGGIITIDMAATQRAVSPVLDVAKYNAQALGVTKGDDGVFYVDVGDRKTRLSDVHLSVARSVNEQEVQAKLGRRESIRLQSVEKGLLKGPQGEAINYPLAFDEVAKNHFWVAPLGGTYFGYKGFGLNLLIELDNVMGGGVSGLIRVLDGKGNPTTPERVSHTIEAYAIDVLVPLEEAKERLKEAVHTTIRSSNHLLYLPGQKEQETRRDHLANGIPMTSERIDLLKRISQDQRVLIPFDVEPISG